MREFERLCVRTLKMSFPLHKVAYYHTSTSLTVQARLQGYSPSTATLNYFRFIIDGQTYNATTTSNDGQWFYASYTWNTAGEPNPQEHVVYAEASITYQYYYYEQRTDILNSGDAPSDPDGTSGDGNQTLFILADVKLKGLTWQNRPCAVYDHFAQVNRPNTSNPYHYRITYNPDGSGDVEGAYPAVYLKGSAPSLTIEVNPLTGAAPTRAHLVLNAYSQGPAWNSFDTRTLLGGSSTTVACPALKDEVDIASVSVTYSFECQFTDGTWVSIYAAPSPLTIDSLRLFVVYATPGAPQTTPWIGVLEDACFWADGKSTYADVARYLTTGFYFSQKAIYDPSKNWCTSRDDPYTFLLTKFLNGATQLNENGLRHMDCRDVSHFLCILANAQGLNFNVSHHRSAPGLDGMPEGPFRTTRVCRMGYDPSSVYEDTKYGTFVFVFHQIARSSSEMVYDAAAAHKYDPAGALFRNPPYGWELERYWRSEAAPGTTDWNPVGLTALPNPSAPVPHAAFDRASYVPNVE